MALFIEEQRQYREEQRAEQREFREEQRQYREEQRAEQREFREEQRQYREELRAEQREFRQENNVRLGRVEASLTRIYLTIIGLMGTIIVGGIILRVMG